MKTVVFVAAAVAVYFAFKSMAQNDAQIGSALKQTPVSDLAHNLQSAWADHHTVA